MDASASLRGSSHRHLSHPSVSDGLEPPEKSNMPESVLPLRTQAVEEETTSVSWIRLGVRQLEDKIFFINRNHSFLKICQEKEEVTIPLRFVYQDVRWNRFFLSEDDRFLVRLDTRNAETLYETFHSTMPDCGMKYQEALESPLQCALYKEKKIDRYRIRWPHRDEEPAKECNYRPFLDQKRVRHL